MFSKKVFIFLLSSMLVALLSTTVYFSPASRVAHAGALYANGQVIFTLTNTKYLNSVINSFSLTGTHSLSLANTYVATLPSNTNPDTVSAKMSGDTTRFDLAEPNYFVTNVESGASFRFSGNSFDPATNQTTQSARNTFDNQWAWKKINLGGMVTTNRGANVTIAIVDSGVQYNHPDLVGSGKVLPGFNVYDNGDGDDVIGHGTFIAGIIHKIAPDATILPVRIVDANGSATMDRVIEGVERAATSGAKVINMSFSTTVASKVLNKLIQDVGTKDVVLIAAAGNDNTSTKHYPAAYGAVLGITATDTSDNKASFANFGGYVTISAPGTSIYSMWMGSGYGWADGTSFGAPMAAATAAIYRSMYPSYTQGSIKSLVTSSVDEWSSTCSTCSGLGRGRLNMGKVK